MTIRRGLRPRSLALLFLAGVLPLTLSCREPAPEPPEPEANTPSDPPAKSPPPLTLAGPDQGEPPASPDPPDPAPGDAGSLTLDQLDLEGRSPEELFATASRLDSLDDQRVVLEAVIRRQPDHHQALVMLMEVTQSLGVNLAIQDGRRSESVPYLHRSAEVARMLLDHDEPLSESQRKYVSIVLYNEACNYSVGGDDSRAVETLRRALELGFHDPIIWDDEELGPLRDRADFQQLLDQYRDQLTPPGADAAAEPTPDAP